MSAEPYSAVSLIAAKRDGRELSDSEIGWLIESYLAGSVAEEQMAALLMAVYFNSMSDQELVSLTRAIVDSGERMDLSRLSRPTVDKHSTGGVGDKVSLIVAPMLAAVGAAVPQLSGRGLGHTGGTLDKLESIPGWRPALSPSEMMKNLERVGCVICAAGAGLAPADRRLYALRDVTATVESIPLIAASIISKKLAEGTSALLLDVKVGRGAFMKSLERAEELARTMVDLGQRFGVATKAVLTAMDDPLGRAVGNALEVEEALEVLSGGGPADLVELCVELARTMAELAGLDADPRRTLSDGSAMDHFRAMVAAQGGDVEAQLPRAKFVERFSAAEAGYVSSVDAMRVGEVAWRLGAGRDRKEDPVSATAGVICLAKAGDRVAKGQPLFEIHADDPASLAGARAGLQRALRIAGSPPSPQPLILGRLG